MKKDFWLEKWNKNEIGFHNNEVNPILVKHIDKLSLNKGDRVFLPLCGKTLDINWLLDQGFQVVGVELSKIAIEDLFQNLKVEPIISKEENLNLFKSENLEIWEGDFFYLKKDLLGPINGVYDRAALIALPEYMRVDYSKQLTKLTDNAPQLLVTLDFEQEKCPGPPFSFHKEELEKLYPIDHFQLSQLDSFSLEGGLKGKVDCRENVWKITKILQ